MFKKLGTSFLFLIALVLAPFVGGCGDDDNPTDTGGGTTETFTVTIENVGQTFDFFGSGVFNTPVGASSASPAFPGQAFEFRIGAVMGDRLSFATMFAQSNDLFYGFNEDGLALFDGSGSAVTGDVTSMVHLWDAGTEANQWPGAGPDQAPRQSGPNTGVADPTDMVRRVDDGYAYPDVADIIRVTVSVAN